MRRVPKWRVARQRDIMVQVKAEPCERDVSPDICAAGPTHAPFHAMPLPAAAAPAPVVKPEPGEQQQASAGPEPLVQYAPPPRRQPPSFPADALLPDEVLFTAKVPIKQPGHAPTGE